jgi:hypothetical protein
LASDTGNNAITNPGTIVGTSGTALVVEPGAVFSGGAANFHPGDTIDFADVSANGDNYSGGVLTLDNGTAPVAQLALSFGGSAVNNLGTIIGTGTGTSGIRVYLKAGGAVVNGAATVNTAVISGTNVIASGSVGNPGPSWQVMGTGGYNGAGQDDILFQNTNGAVAVWQVNGTHIISSASLANPRSTWHI